RSQMLRNVSQNMDSILLNVTTLTKVVPVECTSPRAGLEPFALRGSGPRIRETAILTFGSKFCSWLKIDNCQQEDSRPQENGKSLCSGAESITAAPTLLALLTFGIIIIQLGKLRFNLLLLLIGLVTTRVFLLVLKLSNARQDMNPDSHSIICNGTNPFCYIRMIDAYQPEEPRIYKGCLEEKEFTPERRHQGLNNIALWITRRAKLTSCAIAMTRMTATRRPSTRWVPRSCAVFVDWIYFFGMYPLPANKFHIVFCPNYLL
ncbi:hypothetical protein Ocin01_19919, partial [Orchesella cincta]